MKNKLDKFETKIESNAENFRSVSLKRRKEIEHIIDKARQRKIVSLRVNTNDLEILKSKAAEEGIPYQTLISSILHKYITNQLVDQRNLSQLMQILKGKV